MAGASLGAAGLGTVGLPAQAQSWPSRPIKWVVPYMAGTGPDNAARIVSEALGQQLGQPVVIENRPGAGGNIGARQVARAPQTATPCCIQARPWQPPCACTKPGL
jgi:tripartite-type tricarboxylate transporter receptor subunit TctC